MTPCWPMTRTGMTCNRTAPDVSNVVALLSALGIIPLPSLTLSSFFSTDDFGLCSNV